MVNFCIIMIGLLLIINLLVHQKIYSPTNVFIFSFFMLFIFERLKLYGLYEANERSYIVCTIGVTSFAIGCWLMAFLHHAQYPEDIDSELADFVIKNTINQNRKLLLILFIVACAIEIFYAKDSFSYLRSGGSLYDMRYLMQDELHTSKFLSTLHVYIAVPIFFISLPISVFDLLINNKKSLFLITVLTTTFYFISNGARIPLIYFAVALFSTIFMFTKYIKNKNKLMKIAILLVGVLIILNLLTSSRKGNNVTDSNSFIQGFYYYVAGSMINLGEKIDFVSYHTSLYGIGTFYGFFAIIYNFFEVSFINYASYLMDYIQNDVITVAPSDPFYNFGVTGFLNSYADGKIIGVISISIILGAISQIIYFKLLQRQTLKWYILYSLLVEFMVLYVITDMFSNISFTVAIIYTIFLIDDRKIYLDY